MKPSGKAGTSTGFNIETIRKDFPILDQKIHGKKDLVYLDNAATTQKPKVVTDALNEYYTGYNSNIHRGIHNLSEKATQAFEDSRETARAFINASGSEEVIFTRGTTEGVNLVAQTYGKKYLREGDEVLITELEHHSNIVPWQMICEEKGARLKVAPVNDQGEIILDELDKLLNERTRIVAVSHISNTLGTVNPVKEITEKAHQHNAAVVIDGAQAAPHASIDVQDIGCDFYAFSGHKVYGPTGIGILFGKKEILEDIPPYQGGGEMIHEVSFEKTTYGEIPHKFEAGTPNIAAGIALKPALDYVNALGKENIAAHEAEVVKYATEQLQSIEGLRIIGTAENKVSVVSFVMDEIHHQDIAILLDTEGIAIRTGHHCTQPLMDRFNILGTSRASFAVYNTKEEVDKLVEGIHKVKKMFS